MKTFIKKQLERFGVRLNFVKNLWYLDAFSLLEKQCNQANPVVFDVGASDGSSIKDFKKLFPGSSIYSFEPFPASFGNIEFLSKSYKNVKVFQLALSDNDGFRDFYLNKSKATSSLLKPKKTGSFMDEHAVFEKCIQVQTSKLDTFLEENNIQQIDILKIDVQGGELMLFEGAEETLKARKIKIIYTEIWFIEGYEGQPLYHDIASYLKKFGYSPFGIYNMHYRDDGQFLWGDAIFYYL